VIVDSLLKSKTACHVIGGRQVAKARAKFSTAEGFVAQRLIEPKAKP
jgi:hypothetical protein